MTIKRKYGWKPDVPDHRDLVFASIRPNRRIPQKVDLRPECSDIEDQGQLGSCTANALVGNLEFLMKKNGAPFADMSRLFVYYNERAMEGTIDQDAGAMIRDGIKTLAKQGCCKEVSWPYNIDRFAQKPPDNCYYEGLQYQILSYSRIVGQNSMLTCLADGFPFVCGIAVYESFETDQVAKTGVVPYPGRRERMLGGHAVMAVGYDRAKSVFIMRNSWGTGWGMAGYFTIPFSYLANPNLSDDFWTIRKGEQM